MSITEGEWKSSRAQMTAKEEAEDAVAGFMGAWNPVGAEAAVIAL